MAETMFLNQGTRTSSLSKLRLIIFLKGPALRHYLRASVRREVRADGSGANSFHNNRLTNKYISSHFSDFVVQSS